MTLVELLLALSIAATISLVTGHVISQMTTGSSRLEARSQVQTEVALAMLRIRSELRYATKFSELTSSRIVFTHPDVTGDDTPDEIIYEWSGSPGDPITRQVNQSEAAPILEECRSLAFSTVIENMLLEAGKSYDLKLEYYENSGYSLAWLYWASASTPTQIIPQSRLIPAAPGIPPSSGTGGLTGEYYDNADLTNYRGTRTDPYIYFEWGYGRPALVSDSDTFSVRWTGKVVSVYSEVFTFYTRSNDGVRLWINNQLIIDNWYDHPEYSDSGIPTTPSSLITIKIEAGTANYPVHMDASVHCVNKPYLEVTN